MEITEASRDEFLPRSYQQEIVEIAYKNNTIIFLPTGSGKTFIAIMLINRMSHSIIGPKQRKMTVFLVNTVPLVEQHRMNLKRHTDFEVGGFSGDQNVDFWTKDQWDVQLNKYQVIVLTAQIFLDLIRHGYYNLERVNLLIFDECHQAVCDQPMRQLMQLFMNVDAAKQPRVLGLTATLLNGNCHPDQVMQAVENLETTFHSKVATVNDMSQVAEYSTKPREKIVSYLEHDCYGEQCEQALRLLIKLRDSVADMNFNYNSDQNQRRQLLQNLEKDTNGLKKKINGIIDHIQMCGVFGGVKATLAHLATFEILKRRSDDALYVQIILIITTTLTCVYHIFNDILAQFSLKEQIYKFSSKRILTLIEILREKKNNNDEPLCGIVFVKQRFTAKILYYILKALKEADPEFSDLLPNFIVGFNAPSIERFSREMMYTSKLNKRIIKNFQDGDLNLLIASNVLEEGVDIPKCTLVVKFDQPMDYRSYIQSKGRARHDRSDYIILVPGNQRTKYETKYQTFQCVEAILRRYLTGQNENRQLPSISQIEKELYEDQDVPPYYADGPDGPQISAVSAISLLNRYCQSLQRDKYAQLVPMWYLHTLNKKDETQLYVITIEMPVICPLRELISGCPMRTKTSAKRVAALEVCKQLHRIGELNQRLLPQAEDELTLNLDFLFTNWRDETFDKKKSIPGTKKYIRQYKIYTPELLLKGSTRFQNTYYLHIIEMKALFEEVTYNRYNLYIQDSLINSDLGYALLTLNPLPKLCKFPIYISAGELSIHLNVNHQQVLLTKDDVHQLRKFNNFVYHDLLKLLREFLMFDNSEDATVFLLAPVNNNVLSMDIVKEHTKLVEIKQPSVKTINDLTVTEESYVGKIVCPWYRSADNQYVVSRVCYDMCAESSFPSNDFNTYEEYYWKKYGQIIRNPTLPLLLVKAISKRLNCILPRSVTLHSKRKINQVQDDWEEHLIPEMCIVQQFPGALWFKAHLIPTIIHRIERLLQAEFLRQRITRATGIGVIELPKGKSWDPLPIDERILKDDNNKKPPPVPQRNVGEENLQLPSTSHKPKKLTNKDYSNKMLERMYPWRDDQEPVDIERNLETVTVMEIEDYERFCSNKDIVCDAEEIQATINRIHGSNLLALSMEFTYEEKPIQLLEPDVDSVGPQLWKVLQALTTKKCQDIINLERLETLGDSFLKLSVSLFLFLKFPNYSEGILTNVKGKIIGNRNLLYCGLASNLGGYIKGNDFSPCNDWIPPGFCVPQILKDKINNNLISINKLFEFSWTEEERLTGQIGPDTVNYVNATIEEMGLEENTTELSTMDRFIGYHHLRDKTVSDCVEAMLGAYLESDGVVGGLRVLGWFNIIPESENPATLFSRPVPSPLLLRNTHMAEIDFLIPNYIKLEQQLGYSFRNRAYLLQALTHASYTTNRLTDCYQRLEFLGDAVLDFLITCCIYEQCNDLTPGQLTDLRSALVNNVTFASLAVRCGFHKHLHFINAKLMDVIDTFVKFQEERNFVINEDVLTLVEEPPVFIGEQVHVPKVLGDVFESLAGAVFLDTGMDLQKTWKVFHRIMWQEINLFMRNVPKNPVRLLYECVGAAPEFSEVHIIEGGTVMVSCSVVVNGKKQIVHGFGENKVQAKKAAAKLALRLLE